MIEGTPTIKIEDYRMAQGLKKFIAAVGDGLGTEVTKPAVNPLPLVAALILLGLMKRAPDRPKWFPLGVKTTIKVVQAECDKHFDQIVVDSGINRHD